MRKVYNKGLSFVRILIALTLLVSSQVLADDMPPYKIETVVGGLSHPWSITFLPDGDYLVSEKSGSLRRVSPDGRAGNAIGGVPETYFASQGGFFDVVLDPAYEENQTIYLSFAYGTPEANGTRIVRARLGESSLSDVE